uniref:Potassium channel tetramerization domain containing 7 n=1 Tax=Saimiri boliviensis boliviensis TaxID=39432 RepID=A0A2K6SSQ7_SAIBB
MRFYCFLQFYRQGDGGMERLSSLTQCNTVGSLVLDSVQPLCGTAQEHELPFTDALSFLLRDVLNFLRSGDLPPRERVRAVYKEAQYYAIGPLLEQLGNMQPLKGEKVRQAFLGLMPYYKDHLERIVEIARLRAVQRKARFAKLKVCVFKEEMPITPYECPLLNSLRFERSESDGQLFEHHCEVDVSFGPWEAVADVYDLLHCLVTDLSAQGLTVDHQCIGVCDKHLVNHYYCKRPIYEFKITWAVFSQGWNANFKGFF